MIHIEICGKEDFGRQELNFGTFHSRAGHFTFTPNELELDIELSNKTIPLEDRKTIKYYVSEIITEIINDVNFNLDDWTYYILSFDSDGEDKYYKIDSNHNPIELHCKTHQEVKRQLRKQYELIS